MPGLKTFLWFDGQAGEAVEFWLSVFGPVFADTKQGTVQRYPESFPDAKWRGKVMTASFSLRGQEFVALNGGPQYRFCPAISFMVLCATQPQIDTLWAKLSDGGKTMACGWLTDKFGVTWQITPEKLEAMLADPDKEKAKRAMKAMMGMVKLDIGELERAAAGED